MQPSIKLLSCWLPKKPSLKWSRAQTKKKSGRKPLPQEVIDLIIEMKKRNPLVGYGRISMQIFESFGIKIVGLL